MSDARGRKMQEERTYTRHVRRRKNDEHANEYGRGLTSAGCLITLRTTKEKEKNRRKPWYNVLRLLPMVRYTRCVNKVMRLRSGSVQSGDTGDFSFGKVCRSTSLMSLVRVRSVRFRKPVIPSAF